LVPDQVDTSLPPTDPSYDPLGLLASGCQVCGFPGAPGDEGILFDTGADRQNRIPVFCQLGFLSAGNNYDAIACDGMCQVDDGVVSGIVSDDTIFYSQGTNTLTSDSLTIEAGAGAALMAGTRITLEPGFHAESGSFFAASIGPCDSPGD
jgi:hypothetical protein